MKPNPIQPGDSSRNKVSDVKPKVRTAGGNKESSPSNTVEIEIKDGGLYSGGVIVGHWHEPIFLLESKLPNVPFQMDRDPLGLMPYGLLGSSAYLSAYETLPREINNKIMGVG